MRRRWLLLALVVLVLAALVDGATRSGRRTGAAASHALAAGDRPVVIRPGLSPVQPGAPNTPRAVIYLFASAYSQVSAATAAQRYKLLLSLAAPPLLTRLQAAGPGGALTAASAALRGTSLDGLLVGLQVTAPSGGAAHGDVVIEQWLAGAGDSTASPTQTSYAVDLIQVAGAWRVAQFSLVS
jgi:hypothetical protein